MLGKTWFSLLVVPGSVVVATVEVVPGGVVVTKVNKSHTESNNLEMELSFHIMQRLRY